MRLQRYYFFFITQNFFYSFLNFIHFLMSLQPTTQYTQHIFCKNSCTIDYFLVPLHPI